MKGFVITLVSIGLIVTLITLAMSLRNSQLATERSLMGPLPLIYASFLSDAVARDLNSMVGPGIDIDAMNDSTTIRITDSLDSLDHSGELSAYGDFLAGEVASRTASSISANFTNLSGGRITVFINDAYAYSNDHSSNETLFTRSGGTNASSYDINLTVTAVRANVTHMEFNSSGPLNVTIRYTDLNGTAMEQGSVFPDQASSFRVDYANGGSVTVTVGVRSGNDGSLEIVASGIGAKAEWAAALPPRNETERLGFEYDATMDYTQGGVRKTARIGK